MSVYVLSCVPSLRLCIIPPFRPFGLVHRSTFCFYFHVSRITRILLFCYPQPHSFCNHTPSFSCLRRLTKLVGLLSTTTNLLGNTGAFWDFLSFVCGRPAFSFVKSVELLLYPLLGARLGRCFVCEMRMRYLSCIGGPYFVLG